ncbi:MAG: DUF89 family protein [Bacteroidales bacterium]|nr:DUF89 family protein [Bacteroidales bacterium]
MAIDYRCFFCFAKSFEKLLESENMSVESKSRFTSEMATLYRDVWNQYSSPEFARELHIMLKQYADNPDPYKKAKKIYNDLVLKIYPDLKNQVETSDHPFDTALRLAIAGNIIDYAASNDFDLHATMDKVLHSDFAIDHSEQLKKAIDHAGTILYLGDNAGEIVFDRLFIETFNHPNVVYAVRGAPVINDVTAFDAEYVGMGDVARIISNGYDAPSTILEHCSPEFLYAFKSAEVVISKGQGNLEGLLEISDPRIYSLLMVKCDVIAEKLNVKKGDFVVNQNHL